MTQVPANITKKLRKHDLLFGIVTGTLAIAALIVGSAYGDVHSESLHPKVVAWACAFAVLVFGVISIRRIGAVLAVVVTRRSYPTAGDAVRLFVVGIGIIIVVFAVFALLGVSIAHLIVGVGLVGIVLGIAAQQSLGNIFAAIVLLFARPFSVGDRIRIRSGFIGNLEVQVLELGLTYVTVRSTDGVLKIPNSAMLAAGIGHVHGPVVDPGDTSTPQTG